MRASTIRLLFLFCCSLHLHPRLSISTREFDERDWSRNSFRKTQWSGLIDLPLEFHIPTSYGKSFSPLPPRFPVRSLVDRLAPLHSVLHPCSRRVKASATFHVTGTRASRTRILTARVEEGICLQITRLLSVSKFFFSLFFWITHFEEESSRSFEDSSFLVVSTDSDWSFEIYFKLHIFHFRRDHRNLRGNS